MISEKSNILSKRMQLIRVQHRNKLTAKLLSTQPHWIKVTQVFLWRLQIMTVLSENLNSKGIWKITVSLASWIRLHRAGWWHLWIQFYWFFLTLSGGLVHRRPSPTLPLSFSFYRWFSLSVLNKEDRKKAGVEISFLCYTCSSLYGFTVGILL